jgi:nicotinamide mononucleotide transporter
VESFDHFVARIEKLAGLTSYHKPTHESLNSLARRRIESWIYWIVVDVIGIGLYYAKAVKFVALLYVVSPTSTGPSHASIT